MPGSDKNYGSADDMSQGPEPSDYSIAVAQSSEINERPSFSDETTGLLGAGARTSHNSSSPGQGTDAGVPPAADGWDGFKEFEHLPWYHRPSVCLQWKFNFRTTQLIPIDLGPVANPAIRPFHIGIWRFNSAEAQPVR